MRIAAIVTTLLLAACQPASEPPIPPTGSVTAEERLASGVRKLCDQGRAVYTYAPGGIAVIDNATECQ